MANTTMFYHVWYIFAIKSSPKNGPKKVPLKKESPKWTPKDALQWAHSQELLSRRGKNLEAADPCVSEALLAIGYVYFYILSCHI